MRLPCFAVIWLLVCFASPLLDGRAVGTIPDATSTVTTTDETNFPTTTLNGYAATRTVTVMETPFIVYFPATTTEKPVTSSPKSSWRAPSVFQNLDAFNVTDFPFGQQNLAIVTNVPTTASASPDYCHFQEGRTDKEELGDLTSMLQILYPAHSINPHSNPQGGAEFYSIPLDISTALSVTLHYSVFFPADFDWVRGGKLPGLYGGNMGCSGGNPAKDCFSTRLMWRGGGLGELYLYAPKDRQTNALCADAQSVCDSTYGLSIGRGAFNWIAGCWTTISQTVSMNTPGSQDGSFVLDVNGVRVIDRHDILYRDIPPSEESVGVTVEEHHECVSCIQGESIGLVHRILWRIVRVVFALMRWNGRVQGLPECICHGSPDAATLYTTKTINPVLVFPHETGAGPITSASPPPTPTQDNGADRPIGLVGIFFSTFFGGHDDRYATPRDQYAWFKDFRLICNF